MTNVVLVRLNFFHRIDSSNGEKHFRRKIKEKTRTKDEIEWQIQSNLYVTCKFISTYIFTEANFSFTIRPSTNNVTVFVGGLKDFVTTVLRPQLKKGDDGEGVIICPKLPDVIYVRPRPLFTLCFVCLFVYSFVYFEPVPFTWILKQITEFDLKSCNVTEGK